MFKNLLRCVTAAVSLVFILGCGGGGATATFSISEQNAETISGQGVAASEFVESMGELVEGYVALIEQEQSEVIDCVSGNVIVTVNDVGAQGVVSTGDSVTIQFQACNVGLGIVFNGTISFVASNVTGAAPGAFERTLDTQITALSLTIGNATVVIDGAFTLHQRSTDGVTVVSSIGGPSLTAFAQGGGQSFSGTISDFNVESTVDTSNGDYIVTMQATVTNSLIGGAVTFETTAPFTGNGDTPPQTGTYVVTGPNGGTATLVAIDGTSVQIFIDGDGDEVIETTILTTWDAINGDD